MHRPGGYVVRVVSVGLVSVTLFCLAIWGLRWNIVWARILDKLNY